MPHIGVHVDPDRLQKRWVLGALGIAFVIHLGVAGALGWYKIPAMEIPNDHSAPTGPLHGEANRDQPGRAQIAAG